MVVEMAPGAQVSLVLDTPKLVRSRWAAHVKVHQEWDHTLAPESMLQPATVHLQVDHVHPQMPGNVAEGRTQAAATTEEPAARTLVSAPCVAPDPQPNAPLHAPLAPHWLVQPPVSPGQLAEEPRQFLAPGGLPPPQTMPDPPPQSPGPRHRARRCPAGRAAPWHDGEPGGCVTPRRHGWAFATHLGAT